MKTIGMGNMAHEQHVCRSYVLGIMLIAVALLLCIPDIAHARQYNDGTIYTTMTQSDTMVADDPVMGQQKMYTIHDSLMRPEFDKEDAYVWYLMPGQEIDLNYTQTRSQWMRFQTYSSLISLGDSDVVLDKDGAAKTASMKRSMQVKELSIAARGEIAAINLQIWNGWEYVTEHTYYVYVMPPVINISLYTKITSELPKTLNQAYPGAGYLPSPDSVPARAAIDTALLAKTGRAQFLLTDENYIYLSVDNLQTSGDLASVAKTYWKEILRPCVTPDTKVVVDNTFGNHAFGYVLKYENFGDFWHLDGLLSHEPPNYMVSITEEIDGQYRVLGREAVTYEGPNHTYEGIHSIIYTRLSQPEEGRPGFEDTLERVLGTPVTLAGWTKDNYPIYQYTDASGNIYQREVHPRKTATYPECDIVKPYDSDNFYFEYSKPYALEENYICELYLTAPVQVYKTIGVNVTKKVSGTLANLDKDWTFKVSVNNYQEPPVPYRATIQYFADDEYLTGGTPLRTEEFTFSQDGSLVGGFTFNLRANETACMTLPVLYAGSNASIVPTYQVGEVINSDSAYGDLVTAHGDFTSISEGALQGSTMVWAYKGGTDADIQSNTNNDIEYVATSGEISRTNINLAGGEQINLLFENNRNIAPEAGIAHETKPYVIGGLIAGIAALVMVVMVLRRKSQGE